MNKKLLQRAIFTITIAFIVLGFYAWVVQAQSQNFIRDDEIFDDSPQFAELEPKYDQNGFIISEPVPRLVLVADENPTKQSIHIPLDQSIDLSVKGSSFDITYVASGYTDKWGVPCLEFPTAAKNAFSYAADIWAATITSSVPITIRTCWADLGSSSILGYSGGYVSYRDFLGATPNTWYASSLANAILGYDNDPSKFDMHITYNTNFSWYFGTNGIPLSGTMDFVTVAAHEIAHGLNFSGTTDYSGGIGSYGGITSYPNIYDRFMRDGSGILLTSYTNPSASLGTLLTSNNLWFHGTNAMVANGGSRVKMYAPTTWSSGSSYSHLDYDTFKSPNINSMMVYAISYSTANHNPGPITIGLLKDLGWNLAAAVPTAPTGVDASDGTDLDNVVLSWQSSANATYYQIFRNTSDTTTGAINLSNNHSSSPYNDTSAVAGTLYYYWVKACNTSGCSDYSLSDLGWRASAVVTAPTGVDASDGIYNDRVRISWNASAGATHYQVFRDIDDSTAEAVQLTDNHLESPYDDSTAIAGTTYYYWVKACDDSTCSDYSSFDTGYKSSTSITAPTGVGASDGVFNDRVRITWNTVADASQYKVFRNTSNSTNGADEFPDVITTFSFDDLTATSGTVYYYWVQACNNSGCSDYSANDSGYVQSLPTSWDIYLPLINKNYESDPDPILNGDFEKGSDGSWLVYSSFFDRLIIDDDISPAFAHGGEWYVWFGGGNGGTWRLSQNVAISAGRPYLHFWVWIASEDIRCGGDNFQMKLDGNFFGSIPLCTTTNSGGWVELEGNLSSYVGKTVEMEFEITTDPSYLSIMLMDDVSMSKTSFLTDSSDISTDGMNNNLSLVK